MDLFSGVVRVARQVPGVSFAERGLGTIERLVLGELKHRLELLAPAERPQTPGLATGDDGAGAATLPERMQQLLQLSINQTPLDSRRTLFEHLLDELVPDEARILAAVADGSAYPLVDLVPAGRSPNADALVENASSVGRAAGVALPALVPTYVSHLLALGLVEIGPEDPELEDEYQILMTDASIRDAQQAGGSGRRAPRVVRRTLRIARLGRELWSACQPRNPG